MVLLSWNLAGRQSRLDEQAEVVCALAAAVVCLQEITPATAAGVGRATGERRLRGGPGRVAARAEKARVRWPS